MANFEMDITDLKACPFCGNEVLIVNSRYGGAFRIVCVNCDAQIVDKKQEKAIERWNRGAESDELRED